MCPIVEPREEELSRVSTMSGGVTVIMPNYNHGRFIEKALHAIVSQSVNPDRLIIIDDTSTDNSLDVIRPFLNKFQFIDLICNQTRVGAIENLNKGLSMANTEFISFAAADDFVLPGIYEKSLKILDAHPEAGLCTGLYQLVGEAEEKILNDDPPLISAVASFLSPPVVLQYLVRYGSFLYGNTAVYRTTALRAIGGFSQALGSFVDGYAMQVLALMHGCCVVPERLAVWRQVKSSLANRKDRNVDEALSILDAAITLMRGKHANLFPSSYVSRFEARFRYHSAIVMAKRGQPANKIFKAIGTPTSLDRILLPSFLTLLGGNTKLLTLYLLGRLRPYDFWSVVRRKIGGFVGVIV